MEEKVILVDKNDREVGSAGKMEAHKKRLLHRAFSVVVFNSRGEMLLQKRHYDKYHSGGLWSNASCGHPRPGENIIAAGERRLFEEMGIKIKLKKDFIFTYKVQLEEGLWENEIDHVLVGSGDDLDIKPDEKEVEEWKWISMEELKRDMEENPNKYSYWFKKIVQSSKLRVQNQV